MVEKREDGGTDGGLATLLARFGGAAEGRGPAPVERWNPPSCGDVGMRIAADGTWHHAGSPIGREAMVRLFSTVLRRDADGAYFLVTPVEKCPIAVEDVPFLAVGLTAEGEGDGQIVHLVTNVGDAVTVDGAHPLRFTVDEENHGLKPYVLVRGRLEARLTRAVLYDLVELGEAEEIDGVAWFGVRSAGTFFPITPVADLERVG